jgi:hypothetical protein
MPPAVATPASGPVESSPIAGTLLPIERAEELVSTLPGVISARIIPAPNGEVGEIHVLTSTEVGAKQTVRNVESALMAHLGMRVSHKRISVATTNDPEPARRETPPRAARSTQPVRGSDVMRGETPKRRIYFEDVEVRRSRTRGVSCTVTLRKGDSTFIGESEGLENERLRVELAARATIHALLAAEGDISAFALEGCRLIDAFDRQFVFAGVSVKAGRENVLVTGSAEIRDSAETAAVFAVLDATNRWVEYGA